MRTRGQLETYLTETYDDLTEKYFSGMYEYCYQTGSFVYGGGTPGKSDLDITVVFKDEIVETPKNELLKRINPFVGQYLELHKELGYNPDTVFPGEYITAAMVKDAIAGRGFHVDEEGELFLPSASTEYFMADPERWYRAWLSQSAFNCFLKGNDELWRENKIDGWKRLLMFKAMTDLKESEFSLDDAFEVLRIYGVHKDYYNFRVMERPYASEALSVAVEENLVSQEADRFKPNLPTLESYHREIARRITNGSIRQSELLLNMDETLQIAERTEYIWHRIKNN